MYFFDSLILYKICICSLLRNPVVHRPSYRYYVIHKIPQLRVLDFKRIKQKVGIMCILFSGFSFLSVHDKKLEGELNVK